MQRRIAIAASVATLAFLYVWGSYQLWSGYSTDFDQLYWAAEAVLRGNLQITIGALNSRSGVEWGLLYPLPAVLAAIPVVWMPLDVRRARSSPRLAGFA